MPIIPGKIFGTKQYSTIGPEWKTFIFTFEFLLTTIAKVLFLKEKLGTRVCPYPNLTVF